MNVWILVINHRYGVNADVFTTEDKARAFLYAYVAEWWGDYPDALGDEIPADRDLAVEDYFEVSEEWYLLTLETVR